MSSLYILLHANCKSLKTQLLIIRFQPFFTHQLREDPGLLAMFNQSMEDLSSYPLELIIRMYA